MDEKDVRILKAIAELGSGSPDRIQEATGIPKSTVHYRIEKLREAGIIENDVFDIDLEKAGLTLTLVTEVYADYGSGYHREIGEQLRTVTGVNQVYFTLGDTDFIIVSHLPSREMVEELVTEFEEIKGVERTSSTFVITTIEGASNPFADYDQETLESALLGDD